MVKFTIWKVGNSDFSGKDGCAVPVINGRPLQILNISKLGIFTKRKKENGDVREQFNCKEER